MEVVSSLLGSIDKAHKRIAELEEELSKYKQEFEQLKINYFIVMDEHSDLKWNLGFPKGHYADEWFIARLDTGAKVVLRALPEEYAYDFTTADETYYKSWRIKKWMQFPDSEFLPPPAAAKEGE